jgi:hypothetical protein
MKVLWIRSGICLASALVLTLALSAPTTAGGPAVKEGQKAPDVDLQATKISTVLPGSKDAKTLKLSDLKGKKNVVLWFYPKALTGG